MTLRSLDELNHQVEQIALRLVEDRPPTTFIDLAIAGLGMALERPDEGPELIQEALEDLEIARSLMLAERSRFQARERLANTVSLDDYRPDAAGEPEAAL